MSLLFDFQPLVINPKLAERIGLNEAIVLQQLKYWLTNDQVGRFHDGKRWVWNTLPEWQKQFPFWSEDTIKRALASLRSRGVLLVEQLNKAKHDRTNFYSIDFSHSCLIEEGNLHYSTSADSAPLHTEITTETTNKKKPAKAGFDPSEGRPENVSADVWEGFCKMRKAKRATLTERACQLIARKLIGLRQEQADEIVDRSTSNSWTDVYAEKAVGTKQQPVSSTRPPLKEGQFYHPEWDAGQRVICHVDKHDPETGYPRSLF
ncbi:replication initiation O-like [Pseudomonas phage AF]|uniref:replication initiation O-like n=1 Tax=Pseudomonas phage AF TaxID=1235689 RepID=UPI000296FF1D|nr:replication initiation O-like [Pseudomonas phage AF]AFV50664.1 putative replication initiation protein [Pseudomonas phage AF]